MTTTRCECQNNSPHTFPTLNNVQDGVCVTTPAGRALRVTYTDGATADFPFHQNKVSTTRKAIQHIGEEYIWSPTGENKLKFCAATAYSENHYDSHPKSSFRKKLLSLRLTRLSDYLPDGEHSTPKDVIGLLEKGVCFPWFPDAGIQPEHLLGPAWEYSTQLYTPIPHRELLAGDPQTLRDALNHDGTIVPVNLTSRTKRTYNTVLLPTLKWVCDVFQWHGVWGAFGLKPVVFNTLPADAQAEVMRAIRAYHRVHHALTILGVMPNLSKAAPTLRPIVNAARAYLRQHPTVWEQQGPYHVRSVLAESLNTIARDVVAITGGHTPQGVVVDVDAAAVVMRIIIDYVASVPAFTQDEQGKPRMVSVRSTARAVTARTLQFMYTESLNVAALEGLPPAAIFTVLGLSPQDTVYYTL